jgi:ribose transport system ATP-binding protein
MTPVLSAIGIAKTFGAVRALKDGRLELRAGEIHAVLGENGSGKSTLLSIIAGAQTPDAGRILVDGVEYPSLDPRLARAKLGIALVNQEPQLAPALSVGENIMMGRIPGSGPFVSVRAMHRAAQLVLDTLGVALKSETIVSELSTGRRQLVEIAKGLVDAPRVLLMDEATSSLDEADVSALFTLLRKLKQSGVAIVIVSHRMKEVMDLADRATILRDGEYVGSVAIAQTDERRLVAMMVGRNLETYWHKTKVGLGETILAVNAVSRGPLEQITLNVRRGEIVGLAGLVGSGRSALMRTLMGVKPAEGGTIAIEGRQVRIRNPREAHKLGLAYVPEDRKAEGLVMGWSILRNAALALMNDRWLLAFLGDHYDGAALAKGSRGLNIKASSPSQIVRQLSGGNQQKVVIARELATSPKILLLDEPTRGVDVGAKEDIYAEIATLVQAGLGLLIASSELMELLGVCDRIYVMFRGRIVAEIAAEDATEEEITYWASGAHEIADSPARASSPAVLQ